MNKNGIGLKDGTILTAYGMGIGSDTKEQFFGVSGNPEGAKRMSELTTDRMRFLWADSVNRHDQEGAEEFDAWIAEVQREAKAEVLHETAERVSQLRDVSCMARDGMTDRQAAMEREYQYFRESPVGWLSDRADQMEAEK